MTVTLEASQTPDVSTVLRRVAQRLEQDAGDVVIDDYALETLDDAVRHQIVAPIARSGNAAPTECGHDDQIERLQVANAQLGTELDGVKEQLTVANENATRASDDAARMADELATVKAERDKLQERADTLDAELAEARQAADELPAVKAARDQAEAQLRALENHHEHAYPLDGPGELPGPCECGKAFPGVSRREPGGKQPDSWTALFDQIREEVGEER